MAYAWVQRLLPQKEFHKLEGEVLDAPDTFTGHKEYRPDHVTRSGMWGYAEPSYTFETDPHAWMSQHAYGLPGDFSEDAGW